MLFQKKRYVTHDEFERLNNNLKIAFFKVKEDISAIKLVLNNLFEHNEENRQDLKKIESRLDEISEVISYISEDKNIAAQKQIKKDDQPETTSDNLFEDLTETQKSIFLLLTKLTKESGQEWIPIKSLAREGYPNKEYKDVRSTLSEYISILMEYGLVKRKRNGKQSFVSVTNNGTKLIEKSGVEIEVKQKKKNKLIIS